MIHTLIAAISTNPPTPHILLGAITCLLIAASTLLWLKRGNWAGAIMLLALAIGLGAPTWGVLEGQKPAPFDWGSLESLGETLVGPFEYRFREQIVEGVLVVAIVFLYVSWSRTGREVVIAVPAGTRTRWANTWAPSCGSFTTLDDFGERQPRGLLPIPVGLILEEFPSLGRLDSLVRDIDLVRKRRISVLTAAQTLAQFEGIYERGTAWQKIIGCKSEYPKTYIAAPVSSQQRQVGHSLRLCVWRCGGGSRGRMTFSQKVSRKKAKKTRPPACPR